MTYWGWDLPDNQWQQVLHLFQKQQHVFGLCNCQKWTQRHFLIPIYSILPLNSVTLMLLGQILTKQSRKRLISLFFAIFLVSFWQSYLHTTTFILSHTCKECFLVLLKKFWWVEAKINCDQSWYFLGGTKRLISLFDLSDICLGLRGRIV